uniref:Uncharacterized protein n=1 Tax=Photinus pyralis TaxID=7054 RepID=A0A1Y1NCU4_PHOPY
MKVGVLCFVLLWCVMQVLSRDVPDESLDDYAFECFKELNIDKAKFSSYFDDDMRMRDLDETGIKIMKCGVEKSNFFNQDGNVNKDVMIKSVTKWLKLRLTKGGDKDWEALAEQFWGKCEDGLKGEDKVEVMKNWNHCFTDEVILYNK